ncbi:hypothetical protein HDU93_009335 [Gonapodya sp. JEL0774]|nr:hypothetical protein HDU93_009335 [Gonapodya sp. JEL0774]
MKPPGGKSSAAIRKLSKSAQKPVSESTTGLGGSVASISGIESSPSGQKSFPGSVQRRQKLVVVILLATLITLAAAGFCVYRFAFSNSVAETAPNSLGNTTSNPTGNNNLVSNITSNTSRTDQMTVMAYYANWAMYTRPTITTFNLTGVSVLFWAFWTVNADGTIRSVDEWADFQIRTNGSIYELNKVVKPRYAGLKTMLAIGGWTLSTNFTTVAADSQARARFAQSCFNAVQQYGFDGVDIDWEYPSPPNDPPNLVLLLTALRQLFQPSGYLISLAMNPTTKPYSDSLPAISSQVDWFNLIAYDLAGSWDSYSGLQSPLRSEQGDPLGSRWSIDEAVKAYVSAGVNRTKISLGISFYGRSWLVSSQENSGLYKVCAPQKGNGTVGTCDPPTGDFLDSTIRAASNGTFKFIAYDDPVSAEAKTVYARDNGLKGVFAWEMSQDYQGEIMRVMVNARK